MIVDILKEIFWSLSGNKVRSGLTILGVVIGIASVITMVAIGTGAQASIQASIQSIGSNLVVVSPGAQRGSAVNQGRGSATTLTLDDATAISTDVANIQAVAPEVTRRYQVTAGGNNTNTQVAGSLPSYTTVRTITMDIGSFYTDAQVKTASKVAVLGPTTRDDLFGAGVDPIGKFIRINKVDFQVIGVTVSKGGAGFANPDDSVYVPISSAQRYLSGNTYISAISVAAQSQGTMASVEQGITDLLLLRHKIPDPTQADFNLVSQSDIIAAAASVTGTFTILLSSIAGISLLVGGIGIMNMMLTTVTERTREIGLRKAVGIERRFINLQFLGEAVALTFLGGAVGVLLGFGSSALVTKFGGVATQVSFSSVLLAFCVSAAVGVIFGFYPARKAAALSPIEALRYE